MKIRQWLFILFHPSYWIQLYPYNKEWDENLNLLMSRCKFTITSQFSATIGRIEVWIGNHPYASFSIQSKPSMTMFPWENDVSRIRPSRWTIHKAMEKMKRDYYEMEATVNPAGQAKIK